MQRTRSWSTPARPPSTRCWSARSYRYHCQGHVLTGVGTAYLQYVYREVGALLPHVGQVGDGEGGISTGYHAHAVTDHLCAVQVQVDDQVGSGRYVGSRPGHHRCADPDHDEIHAGVVIQRLVPYPDL